MVNRNYMSLFLVAVLSVGSVGAVNEGELKERLFDNCILRESDGRIWLQRQIVYLGMVGVIGTPPFCLSEDLAVKFKPLVTKVTSSDKQLVRRYHAFDQVLRKQKGHLILVSMKAGMLAVYDKQAEKVDRTQRVLRPEYYEIVKADIITAEFVSAGWIEAWRTIGEALQEIVTESITPPSKEKRGRLAVIFEKGERALNTMSQAKAGDNFQNLVSRVDPNTMLVQAFARGVTYRWQEWLERFSARLGIKLRSTLPSRPKLWVALEVLANSESLAEFRVAKEKIPLENLELLYGFDLGYKLRALETGQRKAYKFEKLRAEAKKLLPELRAWDERSDSPPEVSQKETIEEFGLVISKASDKLLEEKLILSGLEVESISVEHDDIGLRAGDIIVDYKRVNDVVMNWYNFSWQKRWLTNKIKHGLKLRIIRDNQFIDISVKGRQ